MQFQAPYDILDLRRQQMLEDQARIEQQQQQEQAMAKGIGGLIQAYVGNQQDKATAKAFGNILEMHGSTMFGENAGQLLDRYKQGSLQEQLQMGTMLMGNPGSWISRANYQQQTANLFPRSGGGGGGGGQVYQSFGE